MEFQNAQTIAHDNTLKKKASNTVIVKKIEPEVIGVGRDIPEGIFGEIDMPPDNSIGRKIKKKKKKNKSSDAIGNEVKADALIIGKHKIELTDMEHIGSKMPKKKKKKTKPKAIRKPKPEKKAPKPGVMPALEINYDASLPPEADGLALDNVVSIPEELLQSVAAKTEKRTKALSKMLLNSVTPSMLSYDAASNYVQAVLSDGLKIDVEIDRGVLDVVKELNRLDVIHFFIKRLSLPKAMKERFMQTFIDELAKGSLESMRKIDKSENMSATLRELEAVVMKRSEHQANQRKKKDNDKKRIGLTEETDNGKRARSEVPLTPLVGGF